MAGGVVLGIRLHFHHHTPEQAAICLALHQPAAHQISSDFLRRAAEEGFRESGEVLGEGLGGYGSG